MATKGYVSYEFLRLRKTRSLTSGLRAEIH